MKALQIINSVPASRSEINQFVDSILSIVMEGEVDPLSVHRRINALERIIKGIKDNADYKFAINDQADKYSEKTFDFEGAEFTKASSARYDYSDNEYWHKLKEVELKAIDDRKDHEKILSALKEPTEINGELSYPPSKKSTSYVKITLR